MNYVTNDFYFFNTVFTPVLAEPIAPYLQNLFNKYREALPNRQKDFSLLKEELEKAGLIQERNLCWINQAFDAYFGIWSFKEALIFKNSLTLLHFAALGGEIALIEKLSTLYPDPANVLNVDGAGVMHYLSKGGHDQGLRHFERLYALFIKDFDQQSIIKEAFLYKRFSVLKWLAEEKKVYAAFLLQTMLDSLSCDLWSKKKAFQMHVVNFFCYNYLCEQRENNESPVKALLSLFWAEQTNVYNKDDRLLIHHLEKAGLLKTQNFLFACHAIDVYYGGEQEKPHLVFEDGTTLLHFAALGGELSLLHLGKDSFDIDGSSIPHFLSKGGHIEGLKCLESIYDLFHIDETGKSVVEYAFLYKRLPLLEWLSSKTTFPMASVWRQILLSPFSQMNLFQTDLGVKIVQSLLQFEQRLLQYSIDVLIYSTVYMYSMFLETFKSPLLDETKIFLNGIIKKCCWTELEKQILNELCKKLHQALCQEIPLVLNKVSREEYVNEPYSFLEKASVLLVHIFLTKSPLYPEDPNPHLLGKGSFGVVYEALDAQNKPCAIKKANDLIDRDILRENRWYNYFKAIDPLKKEPLAHKLAFIFYKKRFSIVLKLYKFSINKIILSDMTLISIQIIVRQALAACAFLARNEIVHGDVKPENILCSAAGEVVLSDFGSCFRKNNPIKAVLPPFDVQTLSYRSPEPLNWSVSLYGPPMDVWSCGCILYELLAQKRLFWGTTDVMVIKAQQELFGGYPEEILMTKKKIYLWEPVNTTKSEVLKKNRDDFFRNSIRNYIWANAEKKQIEEALDLFPEMLDLSPSQRMSAEQLLEQPFFTKNI